MVRTLLSYGATVNQVTSVSTVALSCVGIASCPDANSSPKSGVRRRCGQSLFSITTSACIDEPVTSRRRVGPLQDDGRTPLLLACWQGHRAVAATLLSSGAAVNQATTVSPSESLCCTVVPYVWDGSGLFWRGRLSWRGYVRQDDGTTPLWVASQEGHDAVVKTLLSAGAAVDQAKTVSQMP